MIVKALFFFFLSTLDKFHSLAESSVFSLPPPSTKCAGPRLPLTFWHSESWFLCFPWNPNLVNNPFPCHFVMVANLFIWSASQKITSQRRINCKINNVHTNDTSNSYKTKVSTPQQIALPPLIFMYVATNIWSHYFIFFPLQNHNLPFVELS